MDRKDWPRRGQPSKTYSRSAKLTFRAPSCSPPTGGLQDRASGRPVQTSCNNKPKPELAALLRKSCQLSRLQTSACSASLLCSACSAGLAPKGPPLLKVRPRLCEAKEAFGAAPGFATQSLRWPLRGQVAKLSKKNGWPSACLLRKHAERTAPFTNLFLLCYARAEQQRFVQAGSGHWV